MTQIYDLNFGVTGPIGDQGATGLQGPTGPIGDQGLQGLIGFRGATGLQGMTGLQGPIGITGIQGVQGPIGFQGATGLIGDQGITGIQGVQGIIGFQGATGIQGPIGITGIQGVQGPIGFQGATGDRGITGDQGEQGITGLQGYQGEIGLPGSTGATGIAGPIGPTGLMGSTGVSGANALLTVGPSGTFATLADASTYLNNNAILEATIYVDRCTEVSSNFMGMTGTNITIVGGVIGQTVGPLMFGGTVTFVGTKFLAPVSQTATITSAAQAMKFTDCEIQLRNDVQDALSLTCSSSGLTGTLMGSVALTNCNIIHSYGNGTGSASRAIVITAGALNNNRPLNVTLDGCSIRSYAVSNATNMGLIQFNASNSSPVGLSGNTIVNVRNCSVTISGTFATTLSSYRIFACGNPNYTTFNFNSNIVNVSATGITAGKCYMVYVNSGINSITPAINIINGRYIAPSSTDVIVYIISTTSGVYHTACSNLATNVTQATAFTIDGTTFFTPSSINSNIIYNP